MSDGKWIEFRSLPDRGVTKQWEIVTKQHGSIIGWVAWSTGWRRYVLRPITNTEWEQDCLRDVAAFLEEQTALHKMVRKLALAAQKVAP